MFWLNYGLDLDYYLHGNTVSLHCCLKRLFSVALGKAQLAEKSIAPLNVPSYFRPLQFHVCTKTLSDWEVSLLRR